MTHDPSIPAKTPRGKNLQVSDSDAERPGIQNADVPSDTLGLPGVGEEASAAHFARDTMPWQAKEGSERDGTRNAQASPDTHVPAIPRDGTD